MSTKIHIVLDDDLAEQLKALAKHEDRAFSRQIAFMLRRALDGTPTLSRQEITLDSPLRASETSTEPSPPDDEPTPPDPEPEWRAQS